MQTFAPEEKALGLPCFVQRPQGTVKNDWHTPWFCVWPKTHLFSSIQICNSLTPLVTRKSLWPDLRQSISVKKGQERKVSFVGAGCPAALRPRARPPSQSIWRRSKSGHAQEGQKNGRKIHQWTKKIHLAKCIWFSIIFPKDTVTWKKVKEKSAKDHQFFNPCVKNFLGVKNKKISPETVINC